MHLYYMQRFSAWVAKRFWPEIWGVWNLHASVLTLQISKVLNAAVLSPSKGEMYVQLSTSSLVLEEKTL